MAVSVDILKVDFLQCDEAVKDVAVLPFSMVGLGLRNSGRMRELGRLLAQDAQAASADCR